MLEVEVDGEASARRVNDMLTGDAWRAIRIVERMLETEFPRQRDDQRRGAGEMGGRLR